MTPIERAKAIMSNASLTRQSVVEAQIAEAIEQAIAERTEACAAIARQFAEVAKKRVTESADLYEGGVLVAALGIEQAIRALNTPANPKATAACRAQNPLAAIVEQLEACGYRCEGGPLESNVAFRELQRRAGLEPARLPEEAENAA